MSALSGAFFSSSGQNLCAMERGRIVSERLQPSGLEVHLPDPGGQLILIDY
jgi:hypothetical protein